MMGEGKNKSIFVKDGVQSILYAFQEKTRSMFQIFYKLIESMLGASMEHGGFMFQADRDYVGVIGVYLVMHVNS